MFGIARGNRSGSFGKGPDNPEIKRCKGIDQWHVHLASGKSGEQNTVTPVVHLDELNPHVRCALPPIPDIRFCIQEVLCWICLYNWLNLAMAVALMSSAMSM